MTLADHPHFTAKLTLEVMYCDGAHPGGDGTQHKATVMAAIAVVVPPGDYRVGGMWPPVSQEDGDNAADAFVEAWGDLLTVQVLDAIPGAEHTGIIDPAYLE